MIRRFLRWAGFIRPLPREPGPLEASGGMIVPGAFATSLSLGGLGACHAAINHAMRAEENAARAAAIARAERRVTVYNYFGDIPESVQQIAPPGWCIHTRRDANGRLYTYSRYQLPLEA